jgi:hypothetical protein
LVVSSPEVRLRLTGLRRGDRFEGECLNPLTGEKGSWFLLPQEPPQQPEWYREELQGWLNAVEQLKGVEHSLEVTQKRYDLQQEKAELVGRYVADEKGLKENAAERLGASSSALVVARAELAKVRTQLDEVNRNVELSQRVSTRGRLVLLARESLLRESRWIEITLKLVAPETEPGFDQQVERSQRVKTLQEEIAAEQALVDRLESADLAPQQEYQGGRFKRQDEAGRRAEEEYFRAAE